MSSTYVIGKRAAACQAEDGTVFYMLSELSYESNLSPREPKWCVRFFGTYDDCIRTIIWFSSAVEGGCTRGSARTPTAYIKQWRSELANPVALRRGKVSVSFGRAFYDIPEASREQVAAIFELHGYNKPAEVLELDMGAPGSLDLLAALVKGRINGVPSWRLLEHNLGYGTPAPGLGRPTPAATKRELTSVQVFRFTDPGEGSSETEYLTVLHGSAATTGWSYRTVKEFLTGAVADAEVATPGAAEPMIAAFRRLIEKALLLPDNTCVEVRRAADGFDGARWHQENFDLIRTALGSTADGIVVTTMGEVRKAKVSKELSYLPPELVHFKIEAVSADWSRGAQLDLLAA